jgi:proline-specific peptidase
MSSSDGFIDFAYKGETFKTYYKLFGDLKDRKHRPVVALHGGPGLVSNYLVPFEDLATKYDTPAIIYDQIGNGKSTHLKEKEPSFWNVELFIEELLNLLNYFGIQDDFDLLGHSWGGILASEFAVQRQPAGLKHLILLSSLPASSLWNKSQMELVMKLPPNVGAGLAGGMKDPEKFFEALKEFHSVHGCLLKPQPDYFVSTLEAVFGKDGDPTVAGAPILNNWTIIDRLDQIKAPTFIANGRKDIAQDYVLQPFFDHIPKVKWVTFENSGHVPHIDEREKFFKLLSEFCQAPQ